MATTAVSILAHHLRVAEDSTKELLEALETAPTLSDQARAELLERLITAEQFASRREAYPASPETLRLADAPRVDRASFSFSSAAPSSSNPSETARSVVYLREGSLFQNVISVVKFAKVALSCGSGTLLFISSQDSEASTGAAKIDINEDTATRNHKPRNVDSSSNS
jgi:hypothetical protein